MKFIKSNKSIYGVTFIVLVLGILLRFLVATRGYNYDFESWIVIGDVMREGRNPYTEAGLQHNLVTTGPIWPNILSIIQKFTNPIFPSKKNLFYFPITDDIANFRYAITGLLTIVDLCIYFILFRIYSLKIASIFFINPITIILSGYHSSIDNIGILFGFIAMIIYGKNMKSRFNLRRIIGLLFLGISLITKHIFIFFPLWLTVKQKGFRQKFIIILLPLIIFILGFLPYWESGSENIINRIIFRTDSWNHAPFWRLFLPYVFHYYEFSTRFYFFLTMIILAFVFRKFDVWKSMIFYTASLVIFSSVVGNQYYAIIMPFIAIYMNWAFVIFTFIGTYHLLTSVDSLHFGFLREITPNLFLQSYNYYYMTLFLFIGFLWIFYKEKMVFMGRSFLSKTKGIITKEIKNQFNVNE